MNNDFMANLSAASPSRPRVSDRPTDSEPSASGEAFGGSNASVRNRPKPLIAFFGWGLIAALLLIGAWLIVSGGDLFRRGAVAVEAPTSRPIPGRYDPKRAMGYLRDLCEFGPRPSGSAAMERQQQYLEAFFEQQGATVTRQAFETRHPQDGSPVTMTNLIASWHSERPRRFLFCAHYDTRPYPDRDPSNKRGIFIGANDGASGTAGLMELAHQMDDLPSDVGVDMVLFDGEEFVWEDGRDRYFIGSTYFAENYKNAPPQNPYTAGVLLDMIGDRELKLYYEANSLRFAKDVARSFWKQAQELGVQAFVMRQRHNLRDDHLPLNQIARIPTIDVIDFDYPRPGIGAPSYWHTEQDIPEHCSGESIAAVVWVAHQWLISQSDVSKSSNR